MSENRIRVTAEVHFAQHLASNQKKIRDRALKRLQRWLMARSTCVNAFTHDDMLKLWKGLFYCMWMSDKPLIQESLADALSKLIHRFSRNEYTYMFIECFFETMSREWFGLDKFRLEKFMMLVRRFLRHCFEFLRKQKWNEDDIKCLIEKLEKNILVPKMNTTLMSLKSHVVDIFLEELARVGGEELEPEQLMIFLTPFCKMMAKTDNPVLLSDIARNIFEFLIYQNDDDDEQDSENEDDDKKNEGKTLEYEEKLPIIKVNYEEVAKLLFNSAKMKKVKKMNRAAMYKLVKMFKDLSQGVPLSEFDEIVSSGSELDEEDIDVAINRLQEEHEKYKEETEQWKTIKKRALEESRKNDSDYRVKSGKNRKRKNENDDDDVYTMEEDRKRSKPKKKSKKTIKSDSDSKQSKVTKKMKMNSDEDDFDGIDFIDDDHKMFKPKKKRKGGLKKTLKRDTDCKMFKAGKKKIKKKPTTLKGKKLKQRRKM